jgi:hypothetical protein
MSKCKTCKKHIKKFLLNGKFVCLRCDELTFDIEIECEDTETFKPKDQTFRKQNPHLIHKC